MKNAKKCTGWDQCTAWKRHSILENGAIHRLNHSKTNTQIELLWEKNNPIEMLTTKNSNNIAYNIQLKIYSM